MAKSIAGVARRARAEGKKFRTSDSFTNWMARLGLGENNQLSAGYYHFDYLTRNRTQLEAAYRTAWLVSAAVDAPAEDMTTQGIELEGSLKPDQISAMYAEMDNLQIWTATANGLRWARLFGGAIGVILIDGQDVSKPLRMETVGKDSFKGLLILDRWLVNPNLTNLITQPGPELGLPKYYDVVADSNAMPSMHIHHTRVIRFEGLPLPYYQWLAEQTWGESVIEKIHDRLVAFDSGTMGVAQLLFKAHLRTLQVKNLRELIAAGGEAYEALLKQLQSIRLLQSNEGLTVLDAEDEFQAHTFSFSGIDSTLLQLGQQLSGALQIPLVRLFGQSPAGLNATGESDLRTYYDKIHREQNSRLKVPLQRILDVLARSMGIKLPKDFNFHFRPLWQLTEVEKSEIAAKDAETITKIWDSGTVSEQIVLRELKQASRVTGRFTNITDEDIAAADSQPPDPTELMGEEDDTEPDANNE